MAITRLECYGHGHYGHTHDDVPAGDVTQPSCVRAMLSAPVNVKVKVSLVKLPVIALLT